MIQKYHHTMPNMIESTVANVVFEWIYDLTRGVLRKTTAVYLVQYIL